MIKKFDEFIAERYDYDYGVELRLPVKGPSGGWSTSGAPQGVTGVTEGETLYGSIDARPGQSGKMSIIMNCLTSNPSRFVASVDAAAWMEMIEPFVERLQDGEPFYAKVTVSEKAHSILSVEDVFDDRNACEEDMINSLRRK